MPAERPGFPDQPQVKIQYAWSVGQGGPHLALDRNTVRVEFLVKWLAENHDVLISGRIEWGGFVLVKPKVKASELCYVCNYVTVSSQV